ncbi:MAG: ABC transporter substrate-binding protein [Rhodospirillales bacterium]|nr:ABC transporter substrate-binding protein [Rhodospirillales bacterium]
MKNKFQRFATLAAIGLAIGLAAPALAQSGKLVLYTSQPDRDAQQTTAAFKQANPNVEIEIFRSGTTEVMTRLAAEAAAGQVKADVLLIADSVSMETLKKAGRLHAYTDAKLDGIRPGTFDVDKTYFGTKLITTGIAVNTAAKSQPKSWADLVKPDMKGQVIMPSPLYSGAAAIMMGALTKRQDFGWKFYETLKANGTVPVQGNGAVLTSVSSGEKPYGVLVDFMALNAKLKGAPISFIIPEEGVIPVTEPVAILKTTANLAAAKAFVDFLLSEAGQRFSVQTLGYIPVRAGVPNPAWLPEGTTIKIMDIDTGAILGTAESDKSRFSNLFGG